MSRHEVVVLSDEEKNAPGLGPAWATCRYGDWWLKWTGWKTTNVASAYPPYDVPVGQWVAARLIDGEAEYPRLYTSSPGGGGRLAKGGECDIEMRDGQTDWTKFEGAARQRAEGWSKAEALDRLVALIDEAEEAEKDDA